MVRPGRQLVPVRSRRAFLESILSVDRSVPSVLASTGDPPGVDLGSPRRGQRSLLERRSCFSGSRCNRHVDLRHRSPRDHHQHENLNHQDTTKVLAIRRAFFLVLRRDLGVFVVGVLSS